jgi:hypothetical protein
VMAPACGLLCSNVSNPGTITSTITGETDG